MTERRQHPTLSDVALALATQHNQPNSTVKVSDDNTKGVVAVSVTVTGPDAKAAAEQADKLYAVLRAKYPRDNGATP